MSKEDAAKIKKQVKKLECAVMAMDGINTYESDAVSVVLREVVFELDMMSEADA